jgi:DNA mismatch repair protein MutS
MGNVSVDLSDMPNGVYFARLEADGAPAAALADLPLFSARAPEPPAKPSAVETRLKAVDADNLSPREALELIYALKGML